MDLADEFGVDMSQASDIAWNIITPDSDSDAGEEASQVVQAIRSLSSRNI